MVAISDAGCGLYLEPAGKCRGLYLEPAGKCRGLYLEPAGKRRGLAFYTERLQ